jgi:hypothetical protein
MIPAPLKTLVRRARLKAALERDLWRWRRVGRRLRPPSPPDGPVVLIVSLTQFVYQVKLEAMLAKALEAAGRQPVVLVAANAALTRRYFGAFGIDRLIELSDYATAGSAAVEADELLERNRDEPSLRRALFHGALVGKHALATASRMRHEGALDLTDPEARSAIRGLLEVAIRSTLAAEALLDDLDPELVVFLERNYAAEAPLSDVALGRGINVVQFVSGFQDDSLVFKRYTEQTRGMHPRSLSDESWQRVLALDWTPRRERELDEEFRHRYDKGDVLALRRLEWTRDLGPDEIRAELGLDSQKPTAVVYSHILWDANMFYGEDLFADQEQWFVETVRAACANDHVNWVIKLHPDNVWKRKRDRLETELADVTVIAEQIGDLPAHVKLLRPETPINTRALFDLTDYGVTIRGSVGIELPCFGVPVLTAGTGFYSGRGFTIDSASRDEYLDRLAHIHELPPLTPEQVELARRHAHALFRLRAARFESFRTRVRPLDQMGHPLDHNLDVRVGSWTELAAAPDLGAFARWALDSRDLDYLALTEPG